MRWRLPERTPTEYNSHIKTTPSHQGSLLVDHLPALLATAPRMCAMFLPLQVLSRLHSAIRPGVNAMAHLPVVRVGPLEGITCQNVRRRWKPRRGNPPEPSKSQARKSNLESIIFDHEVKGPMKRHLHTHANNC